MKSRLTLWAACIAAAGITSGCCCHAADAKTQPKPTAQKPMKAVTPDGTVVWVIAVWDAEPVPCHAKDSPCQTAKCWQTKDGKTICVKPLKDCPAGTKCAGQKFKCKKTGQEMTTVTNPAEVKTNCPMAAKQVKPCPKNGSAKCGASEHVKGMSSKKECNIKADQKAQAAAQQNKPAELGDSFIEHDYFLITAVD